MARDDDHGLLWEEVAPLVASRGGKRIDFHKALPPEGYKLPEPCSFQGAHQLAFDVETFDPNLQTLGPGPRRRSTEGGKLVGIALRSDDGRGDYYPVGHDEGPNLPLDPVLDWVKGEFENFTGEIIGANLLYDFDWAGEYGIRVPKRAKIRDVQWAGAVLDENARSYSLNTLLRKYLGTEKQDAEMVELYGKDFISFMHMTHPGHARSYALGDVDPLFELLEELKVCLLADGQLCNDGTAVLDLYDLECRLFPMLMNMRQLGTRIDTAKAEQLNETVGEEVKVLIEKIKHQTGIAVSPNCPSGEAAMLLDWAGVPFPRTKKGAPSVISKWLEAQVHPICEDIQSLRKLEKFRGTFVQSYFLNHNVDGRIYTQFHPLRGDQYGTVSGRFSSSNPNLQNIPARDPRIGPLARSIFIPRDDRLWWSRDYSQIEYRFLVHYAEQQKCFGATTAGDAYRNDPKTDFHVVASKITGVDRKKAKNINFGVAYGMGEETMAANMGVSLSEGRVILEEFHREMPFLKDIYNKAKTWASKKGVIPTILRRRRRFDLWSKRGEIGTEVEAYTRDIAEEKWGANRISRAFCNKALNALLQGSAADQMKKAMVDAEEAGVFDGTGVDCTLTVHDELNGDHEQTPRALEALRELDNVMANAIKLTIPVMADGKSGANWHEAKQ